MFALSYVMAFIDKTTEDGQQAKKLAKDNLEVAKAKGMRKLKKKSKGLLKRRK
jgi:hypothetical protein